MQFTRDNNKTTVALRELLQKICLLKFLNHNGSCRKNLEFIVLIVTIFIVWGFFHSQQYSTIAFRLVIPRIHYFSVYSI